jgi:hypothetical protein
VCWGFVSFESRQCTICHAEVGFDLSTKSMPAISAGHATVDGARLIRCTQAAVLGCNWLVPGEEKDGRQPGRCLADSLIRREPDPDDTIAREKLADTASALHRLVYQLVDLGLPIDPFWRTDGGLTFDLVESLDAYRESLRVRLGEPYRTMLGHLRHEVGHYYQSVLVESGDGASHYLSQCRRLFGDERADYQAAIKRHYTFGPPENWDQSYISEYATMHPWEDFAECFAHYLHIIDTIDTAREGGLVLHADKMRFAVPRDIEPLPSYDDAPIERLLYDWKWLSLSFNHINTAMGKNPLYPFDIPPPVVQKLGFAHRVVRDTATTSKGAA